MPSARLTRRAILAGMLAAACRRGTRGGSRGRVLTLGPAITETIFAIGGASALAGVSDYCDFPEEARGYPRAGTALQPNLEVIANLRPEVIVGQEAQGSQLSTLARIAPVRTLPWLTLASVVSSVRALGDLVGQRANADALADRVQSGLTSRASADSPRVLLVMTFDAASSATVWFERRNSLHGAALEAAGGRNVVDEDVHGPPALSLERVIQLDPDLVIPLVNAQDPSAKAVHDAVASWKRVPVLRAVQRGAVRPVALPGIFSQGPRILALAEALGAIVRSS
ncbi:MAG TPA: ABC transporter substrate-binding protein [Labilithrix sp.]|nr:ABC transporter substrate-binding protein [Labilithrix sp.]